jgi:hypothetical protein
VDGWAFPGGHLDLFSTWTLAGGTLYFQSEAAVCDPPLDCSRLKRARMLFCPEVDFPERAYRMLSFGELPDFGCLGFSRG